MALNYILFKEVGPMKILRMYPETLDATTDYNLTTNPQCEKMREVVSQTLPVVAIALLEEYAIDNDNGGTGEIVTFARVMTDDVTCYGTSSKSFIRSLTSAWDFADRRGITIKALKITQGRSRAGRDYMMCEPIYSE